MKKYCYFMFGMFTGTDGNKYNICIPSPFVRDSKAEAMKDENFAYRFLTIDSAGPMLVAFANEHFKPMNNGKMQLKCWVDKDAAGAFCFSRRYGYDTERLVKRTAGVRTFGTVGQERIV